MTEKEFEECEQAERQKHDEKVKELEKEAEDNKPPYAFCTLDTKCELWKDGFQKGAKFGYNKGKADGLKAKINITTISDAPLEAEKQLNKAKKIIRIFLGFADAFGFSPSLDKYITEAEQFLKEIEK